MKAPESIRHLRRTLMLVLSVLILGTAGYMLIEQLSFVDALYTTVVTMATEGNVVHPLSELGRLFTIAVIVSGVGSLLIYLRGRYGIHDQGPLQQSFHSSPPGRFYAKGNGCWTLEGLLLKQRFALGSKILEFPISEVAKKPATPLQIAKE